MAFTRAGSGAAFRCRKRWSDVVEMNNPVASGNRKSRQTCDPFSTTCQEMETTMFHKMMLTVAGLLVLGACTDVFADYVLTGSYPNGDTYTDLYVTGTDGSILYKERTTKRNGKPISKVRYFWLPGVNGYYGWNLPTNSPLSKLPVIVTPSYGSAVGNFQPGVGQKAYPLSQSPAPLSQPKSASQGTNSTSHGNQFCPPSYYPPAPPRAPAAPGTNRR
jgi:hypothetical protein